jgi:hypothetical protein
MHARKTGLAEEVYDSFVGLPARVPNLSLGLLLGSSAALLILVCGAGSG